MVYFHTNADEMSPDNTFKIPQRNHGSNLASPNSPRV